jgi:hypothetical protein
METLVIQSKSKEHIKLLFDLAKQLGDKPFIENAASQSLDRGLKDLKKIISGKRKAKTLDELLNE